jgi:EAL domain-containing protein (putative c-di-GMP-specific phosphodiesterase class I)/ActR/RegA family two-component response regulator
LRPGDLKDRRQTDEPLLVPASQREEEPLLMMTQPSQHPVSAPSQVLVVEDDPLVRRAYERVLGSSYRVTAVESGQEALAHVASGAFSAIVSDIDIPGLTGIELLKAVRKTDLDIPVVLVTGYPSMESAQDAVNFGAFSYLTKPVEPAALRDVVSRASGLRSLLALQRAADDALGRTSEFGDRAGQEARFENALRTLWMAFQPIVSVKDRRVVGYEALLRTDEPTLKSPPALLGVAERLHRLSEVGRTTRIRVAEAIPDAPKDAKIFVNLHAHDLHDELLYSARSPLAPYAGRIVLEITERASLEDVEDLGERIERLRGLGYSLAIDDLGAGYAGLTSLTKLEPEVVKLDMSLVRGVDASHKKQHLVSSMVRVCVDLGMMVVTEGVETAAERDMLVTLGCDVLQGYLFGRPQRGFAPVVF